MEPCGRPDDTERSLPTLCSDGTGCGIGALGAVLARVARALIDVEITVASELGIGGGSAFLDRTLLRVLREWRVVANAIRETCCTYTLICMHRYL